MAIPAVGDATLGFIQRCEVQPFTVTIDYKPQRVDITALRRCGTSAHGPVLGGGRARIAQRLLAVCTTSMLL